MIKGPLEPEYAILAFMFQWVLRCTVLRCAISDLATFKLSCVLANRKAQFGFFCNMAPYLQYCSP